MSEFKQIIGCGTRVRDDYGKLWFNIIDYTGSATRLFADFDGEPALLTQEEIAAHLVYELDPDGRQLRVVRYADFAAERLRALVPTAPELRKRWAVPQQRAEIIAALAECGISFDELAESTGQSEADPFDLLCHLAFNAPLRSRRERALARARRSPSCRTCSTHRERRPLSRASPVLPSFS